MKRFANNNNSIVDTMRGMFAMLNVSNDTVDKLVENFAVNIVLGILQLCMDVGRVDGQKGRMDDYNSAVLTIARAAQAVMMVESTYHMVVVKRGDLTLTYRVQDYKFDPDVMAVLHAPRVQMTERNLDPNLLAVYPAVPEETPTPNELEKAYEMLGDSAKSYKVQDALTPVASSYENSVEKIDLENRAYLSEGKVYGSSDPEKLIAIVELGVDLAGFTTPRASGEEFAAALGYVRRKGDIGVRVGAGKAGSEPTEPSKDQ